MNGSPAHLTFQQIVSSLHPSCQAQQKPKNDRNTQAHYYMILSTIYTCVHIIIHIMQMFVHKYGVRIDGRYGCEKEDAWYL